MDNVDYSVIDNSGLLNFLFYPRRDFSEAPAGAEDLMVSVGGGAEVHCRLWSHEGGDKPWLLYFHGNGEVVSDYNFIAPYFLNAGLNLAVADYRGYGRSSGKPSFAAVVEDAHHILEAVRHELSRKQEKGGLWVMGRSLGSISALELAAVHDDILKGMIVESGFISVVKLIRHLGLPSPGDLTGLEEAARQKASRIKMPALIIHGERDHIVPHAQGEELYESLGSQKKKLFSIPLADHNNIFFVETERYLQEINDFIKGWGG